jgi:hypothetical protein
MRYNLRIWASVDSRTSQIRDFKASQVHDPRSLYVRDFGASQIQDSRSSQVYLSILSLARPGPQARPGPARARPAHEPYWTGVGRDLEARKIFFGPSPARNAVFSCFTL